MDLRRIHDSFMGRHRREPWYAGCDLRVGGPSAPEGEIVVYVDPSAPGLSTCPREWEGVPVRSVHKDVMGLVYDGGPHRRPAAREDDAATLRALRAVRIARGNLRDADRALSLALGYASAAGEHVAAREAIDVALEAIGWITPGSSSSGT